MPARVFPGGRRTWLAAGVAGAVMVGLVAWQLLIPRAALLGTTSTRPLLPLTFQHTGDRLCTPDVAVPTGTRQVSIVLSTAVPHPGIGLRVSGGGRVIETTDPGPAAIGQQGYAIPLPRAWPRQPAGATGTVCVWPTGTPFTLLGAGITAIDQPATLAGAPLPARLALWFYGRSGERRSHLSQLPQVFKRATRLRPGGAWLYWLWLLTLPVLWIGGLRLVLGPGRSPRRTALAVAVIAFANFAAWAFITPAWNAPDEQEHFSYVQDVAERHVDPRQNTQLPVISPDGARGMDAARIFTYYLGTDGRPPWSSADEARYERAARSGPRPSRAPPGVASAAATQPPPFLGPLAPASYGLLAPGYYALTTPAYLVARGGSPFTQLTAMRLMSALLGALTAAIAVLLVLELPPGRVGLAAAAGLIVAFQPMFAFMSGAVNNDNGVNAVAALVLLMLVRILRRGLTVRRGVLLGVALVALPLMKTTGYSLYAVAAIGLAIAAWRARGAFSWRPWAALAGTFVLLSGVWLGVARWQVGSPPPLVNVNGSAGAGLSADLSYVWQAFLPRLPFMHGLVTGRWPDFPFTVWIERVWGSFGWLIWQFPHWVYVLVAIVIGLVAATGAVVLVRDRGRLSGRWGEVALLVATPIVVMVAVHVGLVTTSPRPAPAEQGRYLFPAITAVAALAVGACLVARRRAAVLASVLVVLVMGIGFAGQLFWLTANFS